MNDSWSTSVSRPLEPSQKTQGDDDKDSAASPLTKEEPSFLTEIGGFDKAFAINPTNNSSLNHQDHLTGFKESGLFVMPL